MCTDRIVNRWRLLKRGTGVAATNRRAVLGRGLGREAREQGETRWLKLSPRRASGLGITCDDGVKVWLGGLQVDGRL